MPTKNKGIVWSIIAVLLASLAGFLVALLTFYVMDGLFGRTTSLASIVGVAVTMPVATVAAMLFTRKKKAKE